MELTSAKHLRSIEINLLQERRAEEKPNRVIPLVILIAGVLGCAALGWFTYEAATAAAQTEKDLTAVTAALTAGKTKLSGAESAGQVADLLSLPDKIKANRPLPTAVLNRLNTLLPVMANVNSLSFEDKAEGGTAIKLTAGFATVEDVVTFSQAVKQSKEFRYISMGGLTKTDAEKDAKDILPVIQATFDLVYVKDTGQKGG